MCERGKFIARIQKIETKYNIWLELSSRVLEKYSFISAPFFKGPFFYGKKSGIRKMPATPIITGKPY